MLRCGIFFFWGGGEYSLKNYTDIFVKTIKIFVIKGKLSKHFKVSGIPTLIFLDGETGKVISKNGRSAVDTDPEGKNFPWKAPSLQDILEKGEYITNANEKKSFEEDIKGKVLGIYFSAHWVSLA